MIHQLTAPRKVRAFGPKAAAWKILCIVSTILPLGCSNERGFCGSSLNAKAPVCTMTETQMAALPVKAEWWNPRQTVTLHALDTTLQADALRRAVGGHAGMKLAGVAVPDPESGRCDIYVALTVKPSAFEFEAVGHELLHCLAGGFHPDVLTGKAASSYLSARQANDQRNALSSALYEADKQSRWTLSCTFGTGSCPPPVDKSGKSVELTLHPIAADTQDRLERALGGTSRRPGGGVTLTDLSGRRCDIYLTLPPTYLGRGMESLGQRMLACFTPPASASVSEQHRRIIEEVLAASPLLPTR